MKGDRRLTPARGDLVAIHLAEFFPDVTAATPVPARIGRAVVDLKPSPDSACVADTQLLYGEAVNVYQRANGWAWVQSIADGYTGFVTSDCIDVDEARPPTHRVCTLGTNVYRVPSLKTPVVAQLPFAARVSVLEIDNGFARIGEDAWLPEQHLVYVEHKASDWVAVAEMFLGVPYVWGGRSNLGLDCSALVQLARQAGGHRCLRDSDMQEASEGETLSESDPLQRGDLIFWRGHVGIMTNAETLLHANGHHMAVAREPLATAANRIMDKENSAITGRARLD